CPPPRVTPGPPPFPYTTLFRSCAVLQRPEQAACGTADRCSAKAGGCRGERGSTSARAESSAGGIQQSDDGHCSSPPLRTGDPHVLARHRSRFGHGRTGHYARSGAAGKVFIEEISPRRHPGVETAGTRGFRQVNPGHAPGGGTTTSSPRTIASTAGPYAWSLAAPMPRRNPSWRRSLGRASAMAARVVSCRTVYGGLPIAEATWPRQA